MIHEQNTRRRNEPFVFLTGGTGFLGSALTQTLLDNNYSVFLLKRKTSSLNRLHRVLKHPKLVLLDLETVDLDDLFTNNSVDMIVHCATNYGRKYVSFLSILEANLFLPLRLLHFAQEYQVHTFINTDTILDKRISEYSLSKKQFVDWLHTTAQKLVSINVSLEHFYGPMDDPTKFVTYVIHSLLDEKPFIEFTPGEQLRDFIYIEDVVTAFMKIIEFSKTRENGFYSFEVGSGQNHSIKKFVRKCQQIIGNTTTKLEFGKLPYRQNEVMCSAVDIHSISGLGWSPHYSFEEGLAKTIQIEKDLRRKK